jgi:hypothetical protein
MKSIARAPLTGDMVFVFVKMKSGNVAELSGNIEEVSSDRAYFVPDAIELIRGADDDGQPLETKILPEGAPNSVRVGVRLDKMKPFGGSLNEEAPCWEVKI